MDSEMISLQEKLELLSSGYSERFCRREHEEIDTEIDEIWYDWRVFLYFTYSIAGELHREEDVVKPSGYPLVILSVK